MKEVQKIYLEDIKWGLDNYSSLQLKFRDMWIAIVNQEVVVAEKKRKFQ